MIQRLPAEQAWLQYDLTDWLSLRGGAMLVPLGRSISDTTTTSGTSPSVSLIKAFPCFRLLQRGMKLDSGSLEKHQSETSLPLAYQLYVMNGVSLDYELEAIVHTREPRSQ